MGKVSCADIGSEGCSFVAEGATAEEVRQKMYAHAGQVHPEKLEGMTEEDKQKADQLIEQKFGESQ